MIYLSQRDQKWASKRLGASSLTVGRFGCTTTCISMLSDYFKCYQSPGLISSFVTYYTPSGLILWNKLNFQKMKFVERVRRFDSTKIQESLKHPKKAVILEVNDGAHWVVGVKKNLIGKDYTAVDPWTGKQCQVLATYKNITGSAHFEAK